MKNDDSKTKSSGSPIFILAIFIALVGFIFFIPDVYKKYNSEIASFLGIGNKSKTENTSVEEDIDAVSEFVQIGSLESIQYNEISVNNIRLDSGLLSFDIESEEEVNLSESDYYIEFYEERTKFLGRRAVSGIVNKNLSIKIDVSDLDVTTVTYLRFSHIDESSIPNVVLNSDESGLGLVSCSKDNTSYEYTFDLGDLIKVRREITYNSDNLEELAREKFSVQKKINEYNNLNGVTASVTDGTNSFIYTLELDYENVEKFRIDEDYIYKKGEKNNIISFKMDAEGFDCR